ncbi:MAG TPA: hypothetical protein VET88_14920, partial [Gammaproteobacteria bacterium]|nr:hypothetical protein [Gammaproteobacteria bacterium]
FAMKVLVLACFCIALYLLTLMAARDLDLVYQPLLVLVLAFNPYLWDFRDKIMSDLPFLMFCLLALYLMEQRYVREGRGYRDTADHKLRSGLLLGLLMYLCVATREVGVVVIAAVIAFEVIHLRKISLATVLALVVVLLVSVVQHATLDVASTDAMSMTQPAGSGMQPMPREIRTGHLSFLPDTVTFSSIRQQLERYAGQAREIWPNSSNAYIQAAGWVVFTLTAVFALAGYLRAVIAGPGIAEIFAGGYVAAILIFPGYQGMRYLIPVIPFFFLYAFRYHGYLLQAGYRRSMLTVAGVFICFTAITYAAGYNINARVASMGITSGPAEEFLDHVRKHTPQDSVFLFEKPRVLSLLTGRTATVWPLSNDPETLLAYMQDTGAAYLVVSNIHWDGNCHPVTAPPEVAAQLIPEFSNAYFLVYRRQPAAAQSGDARYLFPARVMNVSGGSSDGTAFAPVTAGPDVIAGIRGGSVAP